NSNWDVGGIEMEPYPSVMAYTVNHDGYSEVYLRKVETDGKPLITTIANKAEIVKLPALGVVGGMAFSRDQSKLAFSVSSATQNGDIWIYDPKTRRLAQATHSDRAGIPQSSFVVPQLVKYKT